MVRRSSVLSVSVTLLAFATLLVLSGGAASAGASYTPGCGAIPIVPGIPPWGFHTGPPIGATGSFARGHGNIDLAANTVSGILCQEERFSGRPDRAITMTVERRLIYHSHYAVKWGFPGNIMTIRVRVRASDDRGCAVGTVGRATPVRELQRRAQRQRPVLLPLLVPRPEPPLPRQRGQQPGPAAVGPRSRGHSALRRRRRLAARRPSRRAPARNRATLLPC